MYTSDKIPQGYKYLAVVREIDLVTSTPIREFSQLIVAQKPSLTPADYSDIEYTFDNVIFANTPYCYSVISVTREP